MHSLSGRGAQSSIGQNDRIWTPYFTKLFIMNAIANFGLFMMNTLLPRYAEQMGALPSTVGFVASAFAVTALLVRPVVGPATTSFRNDRLFAAANAVILLSFLCCAVADSVPLLVAGRLLQGMGMGFLPPVSMAMVSAALPPRRFASGISMFSLGQALSMAVGPSAGLMVVEHIGYGGLFAFGSVLVGVSVVMSFFLKSTEPARDARFRLSFDNFIAREVLVPTAVLLLLAGAQSCIQSFILIYGGLNGVEEIGLFFTAYALCLIVSRPVSGRMADRFGMDKVIIPGILLFALAFLLISLARSLPMFLLAGAVSAFGYGICQPLIQTLSMKMVSSDRRGVASNTNFIGVDIGFFTMPVIGGWIVDLMRGLGTGDVAAYAVMYAGMTVPIGLALLIFVASRMRMRGYF
jgi:MFS family permease